MVPKHSSQKKSSSGANSQEASQESQSQKGGQGRGKQTPSAKPSEPSQAQSAPVSQPQNLPSQAIPIKISLPGSKHHGGGRFSRGSGRFNPRGPTDKRIPRELTPEVGHTRPMHNPLEEPRKIVHINQRVGVLVDVQNMYYSAKHLYQAKVNFKAVLDNAVKGRQLIRAFAYGIKADIKEEANFFEALESIGFEVRLKELQVFVDGSKKGDWDVGIAMDAMKLANKLDVVVLVSGDGDFCDLVEYLKSLGCRVEIMAFKGTASARLISISDSFTDLASRKYLIK